MGRSQQLVRVGPGGPPGDDAGCTILHVDMDAFYASVELRRRPELRGRPMIVGGTGSRSVVLSATYEARTYGVRSAMPMMRARRLCPQAVIVAPDGAEYAETSRGIMQVFRSITPLVEPLSLDEAFLDVAGARRRLGRPTAIGELVRGLIADEQGITCSVGVAPTKFVAKLASTRCKPDGLLVVPVDGVITFLHPLPVGALWGVGERTESELIRLGLRTVGDLARTPEQTLVRALGRTTGTHLYALAWGRDPRSVVPTEPDKSIGAEETFSTDVDDAGVVRRELLRLAEKTATRLRAQGYVGRTVSIKVRFSDFSTITRARTLDTATDVSRDVYDAARGLFDGLGLQRARLRLVGVRVEGLVPLAESVRQLELGAREHGWRDADQAVDRATLRYGSGTVRPAALVIHASEREADPAAPAPDAGVLSRRDVAEQSAARPLPGRRRDDGTGGGADRGWRR